MHFDYLLSFFCQAWFPLTIAGGKEPGKHGSLLCRLTKRDLVAEIKERSARDQDASADAAASKMPASVSNAGKARRRGSLLQTRSTSHLVEHLGLNEDEPMVASPTISLVLAQSLHMDEQRENDVAKNGGMHIINDNSSSDDDDDDDEDEDDN